MKVLSVLTLVFILSACGTTRYGNGKFEDPNEVNLMDDHFSESHMMDIASESVKQILSECRITKNSLEAPPFIALGQVRNDTTEQVNLDMLTDRMKTELLRSGRVRFVATESREDQQKEYEYSESGAVSIAHKKQRCKQVAPDYFLVGRLAGNSQNGGKYKTTYYQWTAQFVNVETGEVLCPQIRDIRSRYKEGRY